MGGCMIKLGVLLGDVAHLKDDNDVTMFTLRDNYLTISQTGCGGNLPFASYNTVQGLGDFDFWIETDRLKRELQPRPDKAFSDVVTLQVVGKGLWVIGVDAPIVL